ncbi:hypothetical protein Vafri_5952 [Volvox africanus]|nr:hypothetical protein Vafri_5952 [Volvox africanus]
MRHHRRSYPLARIASLVSLFPSRARTYIPKPSRASSSSLLHICATMRSFRKDTIMSASLWLLLLVLVASTPWGGSKSVIVMVSAAAAADSQQAGYRFSAADNTAAPSFSSPLAGSSSLRGGPGGTATHFTNQMETTASDVVTVPQDDCQGREEVLLSSGSGSSSDSGPVMASRSDPSPSTATLFVNSPGIGDITFHVKFKQQWYDPSGPNSTLPPSPPQAFWGLFTEGSYIDEVDTWVGDFIFGHPECFDVTLPSSRMLSYNDEFFNVTFTRAELKRIGLLMCDVTSFAFVARVNTYIDARGENNDDLEPSWQLYTQAIAWNQVDDCYWGDKWIPYASFSLRYCPCASPPPPPFPPSPPSPPPPPPPPPLFCGGSLSFARDGAYLSSITGDVLFDETGSLMSQEYRLSEYKPIRSAAQLTATPGTPEQEASISLQVFLDLPAGTEVYWELYDTQTYHDWVWMTDRWTWCLGPPYLASDYMISKVLDAPATNISIRYKLSDLQSLGLGACTNSTFIFLVRIHPPTGGDYYVGWDTGGCNEDGSDSLWPLVRMVVWHCPCPPPPAQPPLSPPLLPSPPPPLQPPFPAPLSSPMPAPPLRPTVPIPEVIQMDNCLAEQDDCQGREQVLLLSGCETSVSGPVMASRGDPSPSTATLFVNSPGIGDITFHIKFKQQWYDPSGPNSTLPPSPPQAFWGLFTEMDYNDQLILWLTTHDLFSYTDCANVTLPSSRMLSYNDEFFNVTFTHAELKRIGLLMCDVSSFAFVAKVNTYIDTRGENSSEPNWQLYSQAIAWHQMDYVCWHDQWVPYAYFNLRYCPCASPPLPPSPPSPPRPSPPPPQPPVFCDVSFGFIQDGAYLSNITGDVLFDETGSLMSQEYRLSEYKPIRSAAQLTATPGTPEQEASISMQVFLDLPAGTEVYWELYDTQTYHDWVWMTDRWTWCLGPPYWMPDYLSFAVLDAPATNISIRYKLSDLQSRGLRTCTNSTFILVFQIHPPTGGDYYVGWDTDGCKQDDSDPRLWPLVRMVVWHCPCPPPPEQPSPSPAPPPVQPPSLLSSPTPSPLLSPPPRTRPSPRPPSLSPFPRPPPSATMPRPSPSSSLHPLPPPPQSSPPPAPRTTRPPPSKSTPFPRIRPPPFTSPPQPPAPPPPSPPKPPRIPRIPRIPRMPRPPKPPPHPGQPAKPTRPAQSPRPPRAA